MFSYPAHNVFFLFHIGTSYLAHACITIRRCVVYVYDPDTILNFDLNVKFIGFMTYFYFWPRTIFWFDIGSPYLEPGSHHKKMWHVYSCSRFDIDLWRQGQIYRLLSFHVTSVSFDIGILYLAHGSITKKGCVKYIHDPDTTLTFEIYRFMTWLCVQAPTFLSFDIDIIVWHVSVSRWYGLSGTFMNSVWHWP